MEFPGDRPLLRIGKLARRAGQRRHGAFRQQCQPRPARGLAHSWGSGHGPQALLACPPGELHDMALMVFGIVLNRNGWRIDYLGASTPVEKLERAVGATRPDLVVLAATVPETLDPLRPQLGSLARRAPLALAGAGATAQIATAMGAQLLAGDPVTEAGQAGWPR
jgi:MerR family transcriptional regulator, light-induced transcriptional regulator